MSKKVYYKEIDDKTVFYKGENIVLGEWMICNPTDEQLIQAGWLEWIPELHPSPTKTLEQAKKEKIAEIEEYDASSEVNEFYIKIGDNLIPYWGSKADRVSLRRAVEDYIELGIEIYRLDIREKGVSIPLDCAYLHDILSLLEVYATQCYNITTDHIYAINVLETVDAVENYSYRENYPTKLIFEVENNILETAAM